MDTVFLMSPHYIRPLVENSQDFSFQVKAYSDETVALDNLKDTNVGEILGFILVYSYLPDELLPLVTLLNSINRIVNNKPLILAVEEQSDKGLNIILENVNIDNLDFYYINGIDAMTDTVIKRDLYGTIVKINYKPYEIPRRDIPKVLPEIPYRISYEPNLPLYVQLLANPVIHAPDLKTALDMDTVKVALEKTHGTEFLQLLRILQINILYESRDVPKIRTMCENYLESMMDLKQQLLFKSLLDLIMEERL